MGRKVVNCFARPCVTDIGRILAKWLRESTCRLALLWSELLLVICVVMYVAGFTMDPGSKAGWAFGVRFHGAPKSVICVLGGLGPKVVFRHTADSVLYCYLLHDAIVLRMPRFPEFV